MGWSANRRNGLAGPAGPRRFALPVSLVLLAALLASLKASGDGWHGLGPLTQALIEMPTAVGWQHDGPTLSHAQPVNRFTAQPADRSATLSSNQPGPRSPDRCTRSSAVAAALTKGSWRELMQPSCNASKPLLASCTAALGHEWLWEQQVCSARHHSMQELRDLMRHKRLGVWGDSHGRNLYTQFIRMLTGTFDDKVDELAKHYQDGFWHGISATGETAANYLMGDLHLSLRWHTTIPRMAHEIYQLQQTSLGLPDVVIISTSSWYYRHKLPVYQLEHDLQELRVAVEAADAAARKAGRHLLWLLLTVPSRVRGRNRSSTWSAPLQAISVYNKALQASGLLHPQGPMLLLDLHALSEGCLAWCSYDGIHANAAVYALVNQMIANLLKLPPDVDRFDDHSAPGSAVAVGSAKPVGTAAKTTAPGPSRPLKKSQAVAVNLQQIAAKRAMSKQGLQAGAKQPR